MGERFRLKNNAGVITKINVMSAHAKAIAKGMQKYGMFMADNGSNFYISTNSDPRLNISTIETLRGDDFEVVVTTGPNGGPRATSTAAITITDGGGGGGGDLVPPTIAVTTPTSGSTFSTSNSLPSFGGTISDNVGVTSVTWTNSAGGSGTASSTSTTWSTLVPLFTGTNTLTFTAHDAGGNNTSSVLTVTYTAPPPGSPAGGGGGGGGGGCGLSGLELLPLLLLRRFRRG
jgi:hypothetical protein